MGQFAGGGEIRTTPYKKIILRLIDTSGATTAIPLVDEVGAGTWTLAVSTPGSAIYTLSSSKTTGVWDVTKTITVGSTYQNFSGDPCFSTTTVIDNYELLVTCVNNTTLLIDSDGYMMPNIITIYILD